MPTSIPIAVRLNELDSIRGLAEPFLVLVRLLRGALRIQGPTMGQKPLEPIISSLNLTPLRSGPASNLALNAGTRPTLAANIGFVANIRAPRALALALGLLAASPAWAYIDPNAGGWLYQLLFPLIVTIGAVWAGLRTRISLWWFRWKNRGAPPAPQDKPDRE